MKRPRCVSILSALYVFLLIGTSIPAAAADDPFVGYWALTIPGGGPGWLGIEEHDGTLQGSILWGGGSVVPVASVAREGDTLVVSRVFESRRKKAASPESTTREVETIRASLDGETMNLTVERQRGAGKPSGKAAFTGKRLPPVPPAPDLSQVRFAEPIKLFNGTDLSGWSVVDRGAPSGWKVEDGVLINDAKHEPGERKAFANIRTDQEFEDFNLTLETRVPEGGNSGIYLRGIYEVQVADTCGRDLDSHNMGAVYSRIVPTASVEKPAGQWQTFDITLVDRHVTVVLNGEKIIDNQPLHGCTGGALWSDVVRPGPIYLQGDHTSVDYRNIVLRPVVK